MSMTLVSELFRFATVRPPQKMDESSKRYLFLPYEAATLSSDLYESLQGTVADTELTDTQKRTEMIGTAETYAAGADYIGSVAELAEILDNITS